MSARPINQVTLKSNQAYSLFIDGGARGNPGPAAAGWVLRDPHGVSVLSSGKYIGTATNNVAEYEALLNGLRESIQHGVRSVRIFSDSELLVKQMRGEYKIKNPQLRIIREQIGSLMSAVIITDISHIPREQNKDADAMVNNILDMQGKDIL